MKKILALWNKQKLFVKLTITILTAILITLFVMFAVIFLQFQTSYERGFRENLTSIAKSVAKNPMIIEQTLKVESTDKLLEYEDFMEENHHLDYLVIFTKDKIRLSHPNRELIYKKYIGNNDHHEALKVKKYSDIGNGTMGLSVRAYSPIYDFDNKKIIGVVSLGTMMDNYHSMFVKAKSPIVSSLVFTIVIGIILASILAILIKKQMHDMEPQEIAQLLEERNAMLNNIEDAIIVTHKNKISLLNHVAMVLFGLKVGDKISDKISKLSDYDYRNHAEGETNIIEHNGRSYLVSSGLINVRDSRMGMLFIFRDIYEMLTLTQQLHTTKIYSQLLSKHHHEYLNKLHVIYGLADSKRISELREYLEEIIQPNQFDFEQIFFFVHSEVIGGTLLLMSKQLTNAGIHIDIDVLGEIPEIQNSEIKNLWVDSVFNINKIIQDAQISDVKFQIEYSKDGLFSEYELNDVITPDIERRLNDLNFVEVSIIHHKTFIGFDVTF